MKADTKKYEATKAKDRARKRKPESNVMDESFQSLQSFGKVVAKAQQNIPKNQVIVKIVNTLSPQSKKHVLHNCV